MTGDTFRADDAMLTPKQGASDKSLPASKPAHLTQTTPSAGAPMLSAVSTLLALTPRGRTEELTRLTALAHGFIGLANDDDLVTLAKAVANRDDVSDGLSDRLARTSLRAAQTLIRAGKLSEESVAYFLEEGDEATQLLIARHQPLAGEHITMLVAKGNGLILQELLANRQDDLGQEATELVREKSQDLTVDNDLALDPTTTIDQTAQPTRAAGLGADPKKSAVDFATMDAPARRAVLRRLAEDGHRADSVPSVSMAAARKALDPTRHDEDLKFLTVIEQRDPAQLADLFAQELNLDGNLVTRLMDEADGDAMLVLSKAAGLSSTAFARLVILSKLGLTGSPRDTFALVDRYRALPEDTARFVISSMRSGTLGRSKAASNSPTRSKTDTPISDRKAHSTEAFVPSQDRPTAVTPAAQQGFRKAI